MSFLFSEFFTLTVAAWLFFAGTFSGWLESRYMVVDNAASVTIALNQKAASFPTEHFVSLIDVIRTSLERLRLGLDFEASPQLEIAGEVEKIAAELSLDEAIVNIFCTQVSGRTKRTVSGTGFFITDTGVILTNAHVGQYLLLKSIPAVGKIDCVVKGGKLAEAAYEVELLYISPSWLIGHADLINDDTPRGTGESDFALLYVNKALDDRQLPERFPFLPPATSPLSVAKDDNIVILAGYPSTTNYSGQRIIATTTITHLYTFGGGLADIFSLASSTLGHQGASGGPVIDRLGRAIGVITTKDQGTTILNAITISHIDRVIKEEVGFDLVTVTQGDLGYKAKLFNATVAPILQELLSSSINR